MVTRFKHTGLLRRLAAGVLLYAALFGCATIPEDVRRAASFAFERPEETALGRAYRDEQARHPDQSGFRLINGGVAALMTKMKTDVALIVHDVLAGLNHARYTLALAVPQHG